MDASQYSLLTEEDFAYIEELGAPIEAVPELVIEQDNGTVIFTVKGLQFYSAACKRFGIDTAKIACVSTMVDLLDLGLSIISVLAIESENALYAKLKDGSLSACDRDWARAYFSGRSTLEASRRKGSRIDFGPNVIPASFERN